MQNVLYNLTADVMPKHTGTMLLSDISVTPDAKARVVWDWLDQRGGASITIFAYIFTLPAADVTIKKAMPAVVTVANTFAYPLTVQNLGTIAAQSVVVTDPLPAGLRYLGAIPTQGTCTGPALFTSGTVICNLGVLASGASARIIIKVQVAARQGSILSNTATVTTSTRDSDPRNKSSSTRTIVREL